MSLLCICVYGCKRDNNCLIDNNAKKRNKKIIFKNNALFRSCISQIDLFIDNADNAEHICRQYRRS